MKSENSGQLWIGWTTVDSESTARSLALKAIEKRLAACAQVESPVHSYYEWKGAVCADTEWRIAFKFLPSHTSALESWLATEHPYETHQWVCWPADRVAEAYLDWARESLKD